jgi:hypothetical protein
MNPNMETWQARYASKSRTLVEGPGRRIFHQSGLAVASQLSSGAYQLILRFPAPHDSFVPTLERT